MSSPSVVHKEIESVRVAVIKGVVESRADIFPLFEPMHHACGVPLEIEGERSPRAAAATG